MKITDKNTLLRALIIAPNKDIILEFNKCYCNIYCYSDTYLIKFETIQSNNNDFNGFIICNKQDTLITILKECCSKKSSELEFKDNFLTYKKTNKTEEQRLYLNILSVIPDKLNRYLNIINSEIFNNEYLLSYNEYNIKTTTIYEFDVLAINNILINNKDLELIPKVFDVAFNKNISINIDTANLTKKEIEEIKSNSSNITITYEDLIFSNSDNLIQITNMQQTIYLYLKRCFKLEH